MLELILSGLISLLVASGLGNLSIAALRKRSPAGAKLAERMTLFAFVQADKARGIDRELGFEELDKAAVEAEAEPPDGGKIRVHLARASAALGRPASARAPSLPVSSMVIVCFLGGMLSGCGTAQLEQLERFVQTQSEALKLSAGCIMGTRAAELERCQQAATADAEEACTGEVQERWAPVVEAIGQVRDLHCTAEPAKCSGGAQ